VSHEDGIAVLAVVSGCLALWGVVSARFERWDVSAPIAFVVLGLLAAHGPIALIHVNLHSSTVRALAEVTLALVLFADASRVNARQLFSAAAQPIRLLCIGLPLTIAAGAATAALLFGDNGLWVAALIGAIVAPTDAALGSSVMSDERVPPSIRRLLNVESGLNDGVATPFVNLFLAGAVTSEAVFGAQSVATAVIDLLGGAGIGAGIGLVGGTLLAWSRRRGWSSAEFRPLGILALALCAYSCAVVAGTNGFIAAFVGGMAFGSVAHHSADDGLRLTEEGGTLLSLLVWFAFGAVMLVPGFEDATWRDIIFALLALTLLRMVPVGVALAGCGLDRATVTFVGWFGPRGLASVVFGLIAVDALAPEASKTVLAAVTVTVASSVLLHGVTASPLAARYGTHIARTHSLNIADRPAGRPLAIRTLNRSRHHWTAVPPREIETPE
jgi:NhaP-type Na+/H+ or K+/H+ antiporter